MEKQVAPLSIDLIIENRKITAFVFSSLNSFVKQGRFALICDSGKKHLHVSVCA